MPKILRHLAIVALALTLASFSACGESEKAPAPPPKAPQGESPSPSPNQPELGLEAFPPVSDQELRILQFQPSGQVQSLSQVIVAFNQPMIPLGQYDKVPAGALELTPTIPGQTRWLNEYVLAFVPEKPLTGSLNLTAKVKAGLKSLVGTELAEGASISIALPAIQALAFDELSPNEPEKGFRPNYKVAFNQPLDLASLNEKTSFAVVGPDGQETQVAAVWRERQKERYDDQTFWEAEVESKEPLPFLANFALTAAPGLVSQAGPETLGSTLAILDGQSPGPLGVALKYECDGEEACPPKPCGQSASEPCFKNPAFFLALEFTTPIKLGDVLPFIEFDPPYPGLAALKESLGEGYYQADRAEKSVYFWATQKGLTKYKATIKAGIKDVYGQALAADQTFYFQTTAYPSSVETTRGYRFLEPSSKPYVPVTVANRDSVPVLGYALDASQTVEFHRRLTEKYLSAKDRADLFKSLAKSYGPAKKTVLTPVDGAKVGPQTMAVDLAKLFGPKALGQTLLLIVDGSEHSLTSIANFSLTSKIGLNDGLIWVSELAADRPLAGVELEIHGPGQKVYWSGQTDELGLAQTPGLAELSRLAPLEIQEEISSSYQSLNFFYLAARHDGQLGVWNLGERYDFLPYYFDGIDYDDFKPAPASTASLNWLLSAQPIYKPGETIRLKGISRLVDGETTSPLTGVEAKLAIFYPNTSLMKIVDAPITKWGTFYLELDIGAKPALGRYQVALLTGLPPQEPGQLRYSYELNPNKMVAIGGFTVQHFRAPAFELAFDPLKPAFSGQKAAIGVTGKYHFGSPLAGAKTSYMVSAETASDLAFPSLPGFSAQDPFSPTDEECDDCQRPSAVVLSGEAKFDQNGRLSFDLTVPAEAAPRPRTFTVFVEATGVDQRSASSWASFLAHPADLYVALKARNSLSQSGSPTAFELAVVDPDGQIKPDQTVEIDFYRRSYQTVRRREVGGSYGYQSKKTDEKLDTQTVTSGAAPVDFAFTPPKPGQYWVLAKIKDAKGRVNQAAVGLYVFGPGPVGWNFSSSDSLTMIPDKTIYQPGDIAKILVQSPFQSGLGLLTVERDGIRRVETFQLDGQSPVLKIPIQADDRPNVYVSVVLTRGRLADQPVENQVDLGKPTWRKGYLNLAVAGNPDLLTVEVKPDRAEYRPGQKVSLDLTVASPDGRPAQGEVAVAVVDAGLVQVAGDKGYFPANLFFKKRPLKVSSFNNLSSLVGRRNWSLKAATAPGGGGGFEDFDEIGGVRSNFKNLAYFEPFVQLDQDGRAQVSFDLPDNLTTFKIFAVATGPGRQTGTGQSQILSTKKVLLRPSLPAYAGVGDEFTASVIVSNLGQAGQAKVVAQAENLEFVGPIEPKTATVGTDESVELGFRVRTTKAGSADLTFGVELGEEKDAAKFSLPVNYLSQLVAQAAFRELTPGTAEVQLDLGPDPDPSRGGLTMEIAPSLVVFLKAPFDYLEKYPYACLEQTTSRAFGALAFLRARNRLNLSSAEIVRLNKTVTDQLALINSSVINGAFALWPSQNSWADRNPLLTIYVLDFLLEARKNGFLAADDRLREVALYVDSLLFDNQFDSFGIYSQKENVISLLAYAASTLARAGTNSESYLESFYIKRDKLSLFETLCLTRGINALPRSKARVEQLKILLTQIGNFVNVGSGQNSVPAMWIDGPRLTALTLLTLTETARYNSLIPGLIRNLAQIGEKGHFGSTQANVTALLALTAYIRLAESEPPDLAVTPILGDERLPTSTFKSLIDKPVSHEASIGDLANLASVKTETIGTGQAWASFRLSVAPLVPDLRPVSANGLTVMRTYEVVNPEPQKPGQTSFRRGQVVKVTITFMTSTARHDLMLEDRVPAGFEPINFSLKDSNLTLMSHLNSFGETYQGPWFVHEEFWPDRVLASGPYVQPGVYEYSYLVRAATPGSYVVPGPKVEEMYAPENFGLGAGQTVTVE
ncbi:MAG: hypothetical protein LBE01_04205 [Deltaproteobacteria bacterium]|jgi:uncharacterized protein YfaS (alpha-2-macroglobulin family)|nr:hypothetical protein [Deltaproteobacteria bacterium]